MKFARPSLVFAAFAILLSIFVPLSANAVSGSDFKAGRIIDDVIFTNKDSMTVAQIQQFLIAKLPTCEINHSAYNASNPPPYTCLKDYQENTTTGANNFGQFTGNTPVTIAGGKSSAQIIWEASQQYNINPQVMIVLLQKEQGLVTDTWPLLSQFTKATGYLCPDTAACNSNAGGFSKQVFGAAWQFRNDLNGIDTPGFYSLYGKGWNNVRLNPNASCGTKPVNIENQATAVLYKYTPYTPNTAALNNLNGLGDSCSAYGNRNFWRYFNDWFGSTIAPNYSWQFVGQDAYFDAAKTIPANTQNLAPNTRVYVVIKAKNTGNQVWQKGIVNIGTSQPTNRTSGIYDASWLNTTRPTSLLENQVAPGDTGTFEFWTKAPPNSGTIDEYFNLVADGISWMNDVGMKFRFTMKAPYNEWQLNSQAAFSNQTNTQLVNTTKLGAGTDYTFIIKAKNTGNQVWQKGIVNIGTSQPTDRLSQLTNAAWISNNRPATLIEDSVYPGHLGTFIFKIKPTSVSQLHNEYFNLLSEGSGWMNNIGFYYAVQVNAPNYSWQFVGQDAYFDAAKTIPANTQNLAPNTRVYVVIKAKNTGNQVWQKGIVNIGTSQPTNRTSGIYDASWLNTTRPTSLLENQVAPGDTGTFEFWTKAPPNSGTIDEYFNLVADGISWMNDVGQFWKYNVN